MLIAVLLMILCNIIMNLPDTPCDQIPGIIEKVASKADEWKALPVTEKASILQQTLTNAREHQDEWMVLASQARSVDATNDRHGCGMADVQISGPIMFGAYGNGILKTLRSIAKNAGKPPAPRKTRVIGKDHCAVTLYPDGSLIELLETVGLQGELILGGTRPKQSPYEEYASGGVAGILGAGNYDVPTDLMTQMFLKGRVCVYKPNPVAQARNPVLQKIFEPLVTPGYLAFVVGGADAGAAIVQNRMFSEIVMTGSPSTLSKIQPLTKTPICSELGAVNPWIVVPGPKWNKRSLEGHAKALAWAKMVNNGHTCAAPQALLMAKDWKWKQRFVERLQYWLAEYAGSPPFYPGSDKSHEHFASMPNASVLQQAQPAFHKQQACVYLTNVDDVENANVEVLKREAFCPVLADVSLDVSQDDDPVEFLQTAVNYAETKCFGSLTAAILMDDQTARKPQVDEIIAKMKYGIVGVNMIPAFGYSLPQLIWGAFPGKTESGEGFLGNSGMYQLPEKAVLRAPFSWLGRRLVSVTAPRKARLVTVRMAAYKMRPNFFTQLLFFSALFLGI